MSAAALIVAAGEEAARLCDLLAQAQQAAAAEADAARLAAQRGPRRVALMVRATGAQQRAAHVRKALAAVEEARAALSVAVIVESR